MYLRIQSFLCRVESPGLGDPATGFSCGEDSLAEFLKCEEAVSGLGAETSPVRSVSAASAALPEQAGALDPVLWLRGQPEVLSIVTDPARWVKEPLPPYEAFPRGFLFS